MIGEFFIQRNTIFKKIKEVFSNDNDLILDIGSGTSPPYHKNIKGKIISFDIEKNPNLNVVGSAENLPFKDGKFNKAIMINSFYYVKDPNNTIAQIHRLLKPGGILFMTTPFIYPKHDAPVDKYRFTKHGIDSLLKENFEVQTIKPLGGIFNLPAVLVHSLIKGIPLVFPKPIRKVIFFVVLILLYPLYILLQLLSFFDFLDRTDRWTTYYLTVAKKK